MKQQNIKILPYIIFSTLILIACKEQPQKIEKKVEQQAVSEPTTQEVEIPTTVKSTILVNNSTPTPKGYEVDTTHLKEPKLIDFNGDGKLDAFRVLKNPNKSGMKYLFEFRMADSDKVYFYESEDTEYDLDGFANFEQVKKGTTFLDIMNLDTNIPLYQDAPQKDKFALKNDGITTGYPESCGTSLFFIYKDKVHRIHLD